jgi:phenylpyruvate tautomerase PptA (4-oxalocrotonate tautomerase family)
MLHMIDGSQADRRPMGATRNALGRSQTRGNHFIGGSLLRAEQIFVHGHIRAGRPDDKKQLLLSKIVDAVTKIASVERRSVWVYISEIPALQMIEYGHELPLPGQEEHWRENLPQADREYLLSLG